MGFSKNENAAEGGSWNEFLPVVLTTSNLLLGNIKPWHFHIINFRL